MAEPEKPAEEKLSPNQQVIEDLSWDIPFGRTIGNFFIREGKAVKNGWLAVAVIVGIAVIITHSRTEGDIDAKLSGLTNYFNGEISNFKGQLADAKQDRDKYQMMLAPFEAMAIVKYTNAPMEQRLTLLSEMLVSIEPELNLEVEGIMLTNITFQLGSPIMPNITIMIGTNRDIPFKVGNVSESTAEHLTIDFVANIDPTNISADQWTLEPKNSDGENHWHLVATDTYGKDETWHTQTIHLKPSWRQNFLLGQIRTHAGRSKTKEYVVLFTFQ